MIFKRSNGLCAYLALCALIAIPQAAHAFDDPDGRTWDIFDSPVFGDDDLMEGFLDTIPLDAPITRRIDPSTLFTLLKQLQLEPSLDTTIYKKTNPFAIRSLLDYPIFEIHRCYNPKKWVFGTHLFWNHMNRSVFECNSTNIASYINFNFTSLVDILKDIVNNPAFSDNTTAKELAAGLAAIDFDSIFDLFKQFTVEQRRTGMMFHLWRQWNRAEFRALTPLYYFERNIFADPENQAILEKKLSGTGLGADEDSQARFEKNHGIFDQVGLGDLRLELDYAFYKTDDVDIRLGLMSTLPTWFAITKGIKGTEYINPPCMIPTSTQKQPRCYAVPQPTLDLQTNLLDLITITDAGIVVSDPGLVQQTLLGDLCKNTGFLLGALDRLNAMLLEWPLGNYRHVGLGFLLRWHTALSAFLEEFDWAHRITFYSRLSAEGFTPAQETRFFAYRNTAADFEAQDFSNTDPDVATANLKFLEQELINQFYPYGFKVRVRPGPVFRSTSRLCFSGQVWDFNLGSDFWLELKESIGNPPICEAFLKHLTVSDAKKPFAYQGKLFGGIGFKFDRPGHTWMFSLNADATIYSQGIGQDWTASLNIESNF